ncbi:alpha-glucuronidase family glycosyl hydrolase [Chondrinema litorale]|uniref:alpha-glucuronidase family glycosyl hydrolase n=1 Tax=Chondrinema litorale TaxID=2994555 RepID=UPI0025429248|nr:alpha-glucuronidase family glycosyl hydrolase [Chondrinema litorale]UZR96951.1 alpha-glucuronidase family glycosyl hydrolase [Chondrinema litorale]
MKMKKPLRVFFLLIILLCSFKIQAEDGYELWLRYQPVTNSQHKEYIQSLFTEVLIDDNSATAKVIKEELDRAFLGMLGNKPTIIQNLTTYTGLIIATSESQIVKSNSTLLEKVNELSNEGFLIDFVNSQGQKHLAVLAKKPVGLLYGSFYLLRQLQAGNQIEHAYSSSPKIKNRLLNHWDNLDRTVERGYAGFSIWDWHKLPGYIDQRYIDYARANASIGINGTVLTNVNANALVLTPIYIEKVKALADAFRPYGLKVYLTARFSAPIEIGGLETADPLEPEVRNWWKSKTDELYEAIPDFGGFLVKANSEGQPGPQNYNRTHADGANMLAEAVVPHGGIVMWRAFVYSHEVPEDRAKQANNEFEPLDGKFNKNVFIQVKNGAIDFQPREPFHPLFGKMPKTDLALELQITQEYLGQGTNLVYLAPLFKECLDSRTYLPKNESTVADIIDGTAYNRNNSVIAGVANIGNDRNWTGHLFGQANWFAFGRLAWDHTLSSGEIAKEWTKLTFSNDDDVVQKVEELMLASREACVNYMTPLGLHHIMGRNHHYGPGPWVTGGRPDWTSVYYHKADSAGIGFDRTKTGSNALSQYAPQVEKLFTILDTCPEKYLLWFHHLSWDYKLKSGKTLWDGLCLKYDEGVKSVGEMLTTWQSLESKIDNERFEQVEALLNIQKEEAVWWKNSCLLYFQQFSQKDFPASMNAPTGDLEEYKEMRFPYAPGIRPTWK